MDVLKPDIKLLVKLGSIVIHAEEIISSNQHPFDVEALRSLLQDDELKKWLDEMDKLALIPKKRFIKPKDKKGV